MIIHYLKDTGKIIGTVEGRIHNDFQKKLSFSKEKDNVDMLIVEWIPYKHYDKDGNEVQSIKDAFTSDYKPERQEEIFIELDKNPVKVYDYIVDPVKKELVLKGN